MRVIYHPDAEAELIEAAKFYEGRVPALGTQFLDDIDHAISVILAAPDRWSVVEKDVRRYLIPRFPYAIYYRVLADDLRVLAFKRHRRHPDYWRYRITH
jgi:plasmid stabilization system protein ParE